MVRGIMNSYRKIRRSSLAVAVVAAGVMAGSMLTAGVARADTYYCNGDLCADPYFLPASNVVDIEAWAWRSTFYGHFELQTPNHKVLNSDNETWIGGGANGWSFSNVVGGYGYYCVTAWKYSNRAYSKIGYTC